ncbi:MAG TPA: PDZ domain-containing protein, partial [Phototrophicaceae bacterium]|nr:PDZ domain-containing protein [Phototrophicaceae bacterium]
MRKVFILGLLVMVAVVATAGAILAQDNTSTDSTATAWLGVALAEKNDQVLIARVEAGSPANAADLLIGDVVTAFNGTAITSAADLVAAVQAAAPGDQVKLEILRNGETVSVDVTLGTTPDFLLGRHTTKGFNRSVDARAAAEMLLHADLQEAETGFEVVNVSSSRNPFELKEGDVVTTINGQAVADLNLETLLSDLADAETP